MTEIEAIERVAAETGLEPKDVERYLKRLGRPFSKHGGGVGSLADNESARPPLGLG